MSRFSLSLAERAVIKKRLRRGLACEDGPGTLIALPLVLTVVLPIFIPC